MQTPDYYAGGYRVIVDGAPMKVFHKRSREQSDRIAMIEIARDAGCEIELDDAPRFHFLPGKGKAIYKRRAAAPTPTPTRAGREAYYGNGVRKVIGGVPCKLATLATHFTPTHWADLSVPMLDWGERAAAFAEQLEAEKAGKAELRLAA